MKRIRGEDLERMGTDDQIDYYLARTHYWSNAAVAFLVIALLIFLVQLVIWVLSR